MAITRALMNRQLRKNGGIMDVAPRQKYGFGSFVRSITKPISKIADKFIPNEISQTINKIPAPLRTAAMFIPGVGQVAAIANAASTLARSQGRGLSLGDVLGLGASYYGYGKSGGKLFGGGDLPGFTGTEFTALDGITGAGSGKEFTAAGDGIDDITESGKVLSQPSTTTPTFRESMAELQLERGQAIPTTPPTSTRYDGFTQRVGQVGQQAVSEPTSYGVDVDMGYDLPAKKIVNGVVVQPPAPLGEPGLPTVTETAQKGFFDTVRDDGILEAVKTKGKDVLGFEEFGDLGTAIKSGSPGEILTATKDLIVENPALVIGSTSLMAYLTTPEPLPDETEQMFLDRKKEVNKLIAQYGGNLGSDITDFDSASQFYSRYSSNLNPGTRTLAESGGIMGIPVTENEAGIKELDYRQDGGFVPIGIKEKADDVPAMLSKNEFVMTADAVRGAGNGDIEKGAQKMYDTMKQLESRVV